MKGKSNLFLCFSVIIIVMVNFSSISFAKTAESCPEKLEDITTDKNIEEKNEPCYSPYTAETIEDTTIEIEYPEPGKLYNKNYEGLDKILLNLMKASLVIDRNLEAGAYVYGPVEKITFILYNRGVEQERVTDTEPDSNGLYCCRFYSLDTTLGIYEIDAIASYEENEVANDSVNKVMVIHLGETGNKKPVAVANFEKAAWQSEEVEFDASESFDPDGSIESYHWDFGDGHTSNEIIAAHSYDTAGEYKVTLTVTDNEEETGTESKSILVVDYDLGVWITTKYNGVSDEGKIDITVDEFIDMVYKGHSQKNFKLTLQNTDDTVVYIKFAKTLLEDFDGNDVESFFVTTQVEIDQSTDLSKDHEINLEFRFPYSLLTNPNEVPTADYFAGRVGYHYYPQGSNKHGPHDFHTWFYFGKNSISDPGILRMKIDPYPYGVESMVPLSYECKFVTVDANDVEQFHRILSIEFDPAAEITITSVPLKGKINYYFGDETAGLKTTITFRAWGGKYSDITQKFIVDPLPAWMKFDLTVFGERSFTYSAASSYDFTWIMESEQNGELVKLELKNLPTYIHATWSLSINIVAKKASGYIDLNMNSNLDRVTLYIQGGSKPFFDLENFPRKLRVEASIDVPDLSGYIAIDKQSGGTTSLTIPVDYDKWQIVATVNLDDGYARADFDLPSEGNGHVMVGLDTNKIALIGWEIDVIDTTSNKKVIECDVGSIATDNLKISWDQSSGGISNFKWQGKVTEFIDLFVKVDYQSADLEITGTWKLYEGGKFLFEINKPLEVTFVDMSTNTFKLYGYISLYGERKLLIEWELVEGYFSNGYFKIYTFGEPVGNEMHVEFGYAPNGGGNYQYGFKVDAYDYLEITRTIMWNTQDRTIPRIWVLGDVPLPGSWTIQVLWKGEWYPVPFGV